MIRVFFTEDGYYVAGESIEITRSCSPALTTRGDRIFQSLHHEYKVLYLALCELRNADITDDVMVYGASRIIDELNGHVQPLDVTNERWLNIIRRNILPCIKAVVFFRKKEFNTVHRTLSDAHNEMLFQIDRRTLEEIIATETKQEQTAKQGKKCGVLQRLRNQWFGGQNG